MERPAGRAGDLSGAVAQDVQDVDPDAFEESEPVPATTVTLVEGASFTICGPGGEIERGGVEGLFVGDTRICSRLVLSIDGAPIEPLTLAVRSPSSARFVGRTGDRRLLVFRDLWVGQGMRFDLPIRNLAHERRPASIRLTLECDVADLFAVKRGAVEPAAAVCSLVEDGIRFLGEDGRRGLVVRGGRCPWRERRSPRVDGRARARCDVERVRGTRRAPRRRRGPAAVSLRRAARARSFPHRTGGLAQGAAPLASDVPGLGHAYGRSGEDLGALRLVDMDHPEDVLIAAGAPWHMTLFGRDSILTSWMALPLDPNLALGTARSLARIQGDRDDSDAEEEPGKILHEIRFSRGTSLRLGDGDIYYGSTTRRRCS